MEENRFHERLRSAISRSVTGRKAKRKWHGRLCADDLVGLIHLHILQQERLLTILKNTSNEEEFQRHVNLISSRQISNAIRSEDRFRNRHRRYAARYEAESTSDGPTLEELIQSLPAEFRYLASLLADGHKPSAIAKELGCSVKTVRRRICRMREAVKKIASLN